MAAACIHPFTVQPEQALLNLEDRLLKYPKTTLPQLIRLQVPYEVMCEGDDGLHAVPQLNIVEMLQQVAHLQLCTLRHLHVEQAFAVLVFTL